MESKDYNKLFDRAMESLELRCTLASLDGEHITTREQLESLIREVARDITRSLKTKQLLQFAINNTWLAEIPTEYTSEPEDSSACAAIRAALIHELAGDMLFCSTPLGFLDGKPG